MSHVALAGIHIVGSTRSNIGHDSQTLNSAKPWMDAFGVGCGRSDGGHRFHAPYTSGRLRKIAIIIYFQLSCHELERYSIKLIVLVLT